MTRIQPIVVSFSVVKVNIPKKMLSRVFDEHKPIDMKTYMKISRKMAQIEQAIHQLENVRSVVEIIERRWIPGTPTSCITPENSHTL